MTLVLQTTRGEFGNCFAACMASILEMPIDMMPDYFKGIPDNPEWLNEWRAWLKPYGLGITWHEFKGHRKPPGYSILQLENGDIRHCVVCLNGEIEFDPLGGGLDEMKSAYWYLLTALDPKVLVER